MLNKVRLAPIDPKTAKKCGIATFFSFLFFGLLPIVPYLVSVEIMHENTQEWVPVICLGAVELFSLGVGKGALIGLSRLKSGA